MLALVETELSESAIDVLREINADDIVGCTNLDERRGKPPATTLVSFGKSPPTALAIDALGISIAEAAMDASDDRRRRPPAISRGKPGTSSPWLLPSPGPPETIKCDCSIPRLAPELPITPNARWSFFNTDSCRCWVPYSPRPPDFVPEACGAKVVTGWIFGIGLVSARLTVTCHMP